MPHRVLIDAIIYDLFEQHINAIVCRLSIPQLSDVHPRTHPDVFLPVKRTDVILCVRYLLFSRHGQRN